MKNQVFRPENFWQSSLMMLPDNSFFELVRSVFGNIKTPFNKQKLLEDLSIFLSRPEIQETIAAFIDNDDRRIIAAIALLGEPLPGELERFFSGEFSYMELQAMLLNLEERLILYRFRDEGKFRLALNPRLEPVLLPISRDFSLLFPSGPVQEEAEAPAGGETQNALTDERLFAALFAFFLSGGESRAKNARRPDAGEKLFPGFDMEALAGGLVRLGLLSRQEETLQADEEKIASFRECDQYSRLIYLASGAALHLEGAAEYMSRNLLRNTALLLHRLFSSLEKNRLYGEPVLVKCVEILRRDSEPDTWGDFGGKIPPTRTLIFAAEKTGLIRRFGGAYRFALDAPRPKAPAKTSPRIAFDSPFGFILYPGMSFADALDLAAFSSVEETGTAVRFSLSRESAVRAFDRGYTADYLWRLLKRLSLDRADDALRLNLEDWEKRYREVAVYEGTILSLSGERAYLAESGPLSAMVKKVLVPASASRPGIFLLTARREDIENALRSAGVDILARPVLGARGADVPSRRFFSGFGKLDLPENSRNDFFAEAGKKKGGQKKTADSEAPLQKAEHIKETFRTSLDRMKVSRQERDELLARIGRRIIVSESQLKDASIRYEKLEARGLDYVGKTAVAKQAIEQTSLVEVHWSNGGEELMFLGTPESLEKKGGETILVVKPRGGEAEPARIPLGKISLIRRVKQSIFGE